MEATTTLGLIEASGVHSVSAVYDYDEADAVSRLSEIDRRILRLVAQGFTSKEIARQLDRSPLTIDDRIKDACSRLGADTRAQAASMVLLADSVVPPELGGHPVQGIDRRRTTRPDAREDGDPARHPARDTSSFLASALDPRLTQVGLKVLLICIAIAVTAYFLAGAIVAIQDVFLNVLRG